MAPQLQPAPAAPQAPAQEAGDAYLDVLSPESLHVLESFGREAPQILNAYCCVLEDSLTHQAAQTHQMRQIAEQLHAQLQNAQAVIAAAAEDNAALHAVLDTPELLAPYVNEFFGPNGPYPIETARDRLEADVRAGEAGRALPAPRAALPPTMEQPAYQEPYAQNLAPQPLPPAPSYQRPQLDVPAPQGAPAGALLMDRATFSSLYDANPAGVAEMIYNMSPEQVRQVMAGPSMIGY